MTFKPSIARAPLYAYFSIFFVLIITILSIVTRLKAPIDGAGSITTNGICTITAIRSGSPADKAGLEVGDIIESVGSTHVSDSGHMKLLSAYRAGESVEYHIIRDQVEMSRTVTFKSFWSQYPVFYFFLYLLILMVSTTSIYILFRKPYDLSARAFFVYLQLLALAQNSRVFFLEDPSALIANTAFLLSFNLFGIALFHFYLVFPEPVPVYTGMKKYLKMFYILGTALGICLSVLMVMITYGYSGKPLKIFNELNRASVGWMGLILVLAFITAIYQFLQAKSPLTRKQFRLVVIGSAFGLITPILFSIYPSFIWRMESERHLFSLLEFTNGIGTYIMTSFLAVAIFRYRIWNIEPILRQALVYTIATIFIAMVYLILIAVVKFLTIEMTTIVQFSLILASCVIFLILRDAFQRRVDRLFFRYSYDSAEAVSKFEENLSGVYKTEELQNKILESLNEIFHFKSFAMAMKKNGSIYKIELDYDMGNGYEKPEIIGTSELNQLLIKAKIFSVDELSDKPGLFKSNHCELIVPLNEGQKPIGFFLMGQKRSEKSYSLQDTRILSLLANRVVSIFKTTRLYEQDYNRQLMLNKERTRIAKDIHDELGASLTRISILSQVMQTNAENEQQIKQWSAKIHDTCSEIRQEMRQIIWALNTNEDKFEGLIAYLRRYTLEQFEYTKVKCTFRLPETIPEMDLGVEERRNIFLCTKEALNNILKHAEANNVRISLDIHMEDQILTIEDDGKGMDILNGSPDGNGLKNIRKRITDIGGKVFFNSSPGKGTTISMVLPVKPKPRS